jgi:hypothetical protein
MNDTPKSKSRLPSRDALLTRQQKLQEKLNALAHEERNLKKQLSIINARDSEAIRKRDTRRKILLGGELIAAAKSGDQIALDLIARFIANQDKAHNVKAFEGWKP